MTGLHDRAPADNHRQGTPPSHPLRYGPKPGPTVGATHYRSGVARRPTKRVFARPAEPMPQNRTAKNLIERLAAAEANVNIAVGRPGRAN